MKINDQELAQFVNYFTRSIHIVRQYKDEQTLKLLRDAMPFRNISTISEVEACAKWFKRDFMKWSDDPNLPRHEHIPTLLQTRIGRCGEWAIVFTGMLVAAGLRARYVLDWTDHVWTEVALNGSWVAVDSTVDNPLMPRFAREDSGKKLSYIIAFDMDWIEDVTLGYIRKSLWEWRKRRKLDPIPKHLISAYNEHRCVVVP